MVGLYLQKTLTQQLGSLLRMMTWWGRTWKCPGGIQTTFVQTRKWIWYVAIVYFCRTVMCVFGLKIAMSAYTEFGFYIFQCQCVVCVAFSLVLSCARQASSQECVRTWIYIVTGGKRDAPTVHGGSKIGSPLGSIDAWSHISPVGMLIFVWSCKTHRWERGIVYDHGWQHCNIYPKLLVVNFLPLHLIISTWLAICCSISAQHWALY